MKSLSTSLRERYPEDQLHVLVTKRNAGSFTYDGAEIGGERAVVEIEEKLQELEESGHTIQKISIIGYSFGGLIARYAVGLLYHHGLFARIKPMVSSLHRGYGKEANTARTSPPLQHLILVSARH